jgi:hypothetical protein
VPDIREHIRGSKGRFDTVIGNAIEVGWSLEQLGRRKTLPTASS